MALASAPLIVSIITQFLRLCSTEHNRKNWLFSDSQDGSEASMLCYTIIEMAKLYNIKIYDYILFLLSERPSMNMTDEELDKLLPWSEGIQERIQTFINSKESQ